MTRPTPDEEFDDASTPAEEVLPGLDLLDPLVVGEDTYDDDGTGGLAFADAPLDDETPVDELVGLPSGLGDERLDVGDEPLDDATTLPPSADGLEVDDDDTPPDGAAAAEGLDERITLPPETDEPPPP